MIVVRWIGELFVGLLEMLIDAATSTEPKLRVRLGLLIVALLLLASAVLSGSHGIRFVIAAVLFVLLLSGYVGDVARARRLLRRAVFGDGRAPHLPELALSGRAHSVVALAKAFSSARAGDTERAELQLHEVSREDLGAWETRVLEGVRAMVADAHPHSGRLAQLAPLALPTGNVDVDLKLARSLVASAWKDESRLAAIEPTIRRAGGPVATLAELCRLRRRDLAGALESEPALALEDAERVAEEARQFGDERLSERLLSMASRRGAYR